MRYFCVIVINNLCNNETCRVTFVRRVLTGGPSIFYIAFSSVAIYLQYVVPLTYEHSR